MPLGYCKSTDFVSSHEAHHVFQDSKFKCTVVKSCLAKGCQPKVLYARPHLVNAGTHKLVLSQVTAETVDLMLDWLYGAFQASLSLPQIVALFQASHMFAITQLEAQCVEALKVFMSSQTCLQLADLAIEHHCPTLIEVRVFQYCLWLTVAMCLEPSVSRYQNGHVM